MVGFRGPGRAAAAVVVLLAPSLPSGCAHDRALSLSLRPEVRRPEIAAVLFFIDGVGHQRLTRLAEEGALPNIQGELLDRGTSVDFAVSCHPTLTYAITTSILTGCYPGHHGILGNKWYDRHHLRLRDYALIRTYRLVGQDYAVPTIYEYLPGHYTVSIQCANRRGATRSFDNWASSGINWFFGQYLMVDRLVAVRFEQMAAECNRVRRWPTFIHAYFPAVDEIGHRFGPDSSESREALVNADRQIGRICQGLRNAGLLDRTYRVLISDHGMVAIQPGQWLDVARLLNSRFGLNVSSSLDEQTTNYPERFAKYDACQAVLTVSGDRSAMITLRFDRTWRDRPAEVLDTPIFAAKKPAPTVGDLARALANEPAVALVAARDGCDAVTIFAADGLGRICRRATAGGPAYTYTKVTGSDPLGYDGEPKAGALLGGWHSADEWFAASVGTRYPDAVGQLVNLFDHHRTGDLVLFAAAGWDFAGCTRGGHGSILTGDMQVPMIFAGPGIPAGGRLARARLIDLTPTILDLLGVPCPAEEFDGRSLKPLLVAEDQPLSAATVR